MGRREIGEKLFSYSQGGKGNLSISRRSFLKYAAASIAAIGAAAGVYYSGRKREETFTSQPSTTTTIQTIETLRITEKTNRPPELPLVCERKGSPPLLVCKEAIEIWPKYINPTTEYEIRLSHNAYDPDGDPLTTTWLIDGEEVSHEPRYFTKLPEGEHLIGLRVSDGMEERGAETRVTVEPDRIYPTKPLSVRYKGMRMTVGWKGMPHIPIDFTDEKLDIIRNELGCNAVIIFGNTEFEDDLVEAGRLAIEKKFDRIYVAPMYLDFTIEETVERIGKFAGKVKRLREISDSVIFMVGHEFILDSSSFVPGVTYEERELNAWKGRTNWVKLRSILPCAFNKIISLCEQNYGYQITYAASIGEENLVPWSNPIFESVGIDAYIWNRVGWTENWIIDLLKRLKKFGKPVNTTEWGCLTYKNASEDWQITAGMEKYPYDEDEQANYIRQYCEMLNKAKINGAFYTQIDDERPKGYGLYLRSVTGKMRRKKGFYMYKSYYIKK
jgi:hypothetical protein